jgi:hypothetical protein
MFTWLVEAFSVSYTAPTFTLANVRRRELGGNSDGETLCGLLVSMYGSPTHMILRGETVGWLKTVGVGSTRMGRISSPAD